MASADAEEKCHSASNLQQNGVKNGVCKKGSANGHADGAPPSAVNRPTSSSMMDNLVSMLIERCKALGSKTIDLSNRGIKKIPSELLELKNLEYLYLEGNNLTCLPEDFFDCLPNLKWLDLRRNYLVTLPSTYIGRHTCLKNLLLEGNELRSLPLELGLLETLTGLNINSNPLEFPPQAIIEKGVDEILRYLREMLLTKSQGKTPLSVPELNRIAELSIRDGDTSSDDSYDYHGMPDIQDYGYERHDIPTNHMDDQMSLRSEKLGPLPVHSAALHKPVSYYQIKQQHLEKVKKAGASGKLDKSKSLSGGSRRTTSRKSQQLSRYPALPPMELIEQRALEEKRLKKLKLVKEKQDAILQKRKDVDMLKGFRDETRQLQRKKYTQRLRKGEDYKEPATSAPFGIEKEHLKMKNNEERIKEEVKSAHEKIRRQMSPTTRLRLEEARLQRDRELEVKIKMHTQEMVERRKQPKGNPREDMAAAQRDMEIADMLSKELQERRKQLEYRFQAFTGDPTPKPIMDLKSTYFR